MKKKKKQLLIFLIVFLVLAAAAALLLLLPHPDNGEDSSSADSASVTVWQYGKEEVAGIAVENETGSYLIEPGGDGFVIAELASYPQYNTQYTYIVSALTELSASQVVEEAPESLDKYGLSAPRATAELRLNDGSVKQVFLGDVSPDAVSCYGMTGDSGTVYLFDGTTAGYLTQDKFSYLSRSLTKGSEAGVDESGETESKTPTLEYLKIERPDLPQPITVEPSGEENTEGLTVSGYTITSPVVIDVGYEQKTTYLDETIGMAASKIAGIASTPEEKAAYGLDTPTMRLEIRLDGETTRMTFGSKLPDGSGYYMMTDKTDLVYEMANEMTPWMTVRTEDLMSTLLLNPMIGTVAQVTVTADGKDYAFDLIGDENTAPADLKIQYNGQQIRTENFQKYYMVLISLEAVEINTDEATGSPEVTIRYRYRDESKEDDLIELVPMTDRRYSIRVNGRDDFVAYATTVQKIKNDLATLLSGGEIDTNY